MIIYVFAPPVLWLSFSEREHTTVCNVLRSASSYDSEIHGVGPSKIPFLQAKLEHARKDRNTVRLSASVPELEDFVDLVASAEYHNRVAKIQNVGAVEDRLAQILDEIHRLEPMFH